MGGIWTRHIATIAMVLTGSVTARAELELDHVDARGFAEAGSPAYRQLIFHADLLDAKRKLVRGFESSDKLSTLKVLVDDKEIAGAFQVKTAGETVEPLALGIVLAGHLDYFMKDAEAGQTESALEVQVRGYNELLKKLARPGREFAVWYYHNRRVFPVFDWRSNPEPLSDVKPLENAQTADKPPSMFASIERLLLSMRDRPDLPRRRAIILLSDGYDVHGAPAEKKLEVVVRLAQELAVEIHTLAYSLSDTRDNYGNLEGLAKGTGGTYRELGDISLEDIAKALASFADELEQRYVITFTPSDWRGADNPVNIQLALTAPDGSPLKAGQSGLKVGPLPPEHWTVRARWPLIGAAALLGLAMVWMALKWFRRAAKGAVADKGPA